MARLYFRIKGGAIVFGPGSLREAATAQGAGDQNLAPHLASDAELRAIGVRWVDEPDAPDLQHVVLDSFALVAGEVEPVWRFAEDAGKVSRRNAEQRRARIEKRIAKLRAAGDTESRLAALELHIFGEQ